MTDWEQIINGVAVTLGGEGERGRQLLRECWDGTAESDHPQRCVLAHYLADLEEALEAEVRWDETALASYRHVAPADLAMIGIPDAAGLAPSLHLNLGDGYLRQSRLDEAQVQAAAGRAAIGAIGSDGYAAMISDGLHRLQERISTARRSS
jgi:hypothetical protein